MDIIIDSYGTEYLIGCLAAQNSNGGLFGYIIMDTSSQSYDAYSFAISAVVSCQRMIYDNST